MLRPPCFPRLDHLLFKFGRQVFIVAELLRVEAAAAGQGTKLAGVAIEFPCWRQRMYNLDTASCVHAHDSATPAGQVTDDLTDTIFRDSNFERMDRLKQTGSCLEECLFERPVAGHLKRDIVRI